MDIAVRTANEFIAIEDHVPTGRTAKAKPERRSPAKRHSGPAAAAEGTRSLRTPRPRAGQPAELLGGFFMTFQVTENDGHGTFPAIVPFVIEHQFQISSFSISIAGSAQR